MTVCDTPCFGVEKILKAVVSQCLAPTPGPRHDKREPLNRIMHITEARSCWGVARTALTVFIVGVFVVYLFGGFQAASVLAN